MDDNRNCPVCNEEVSMLAKRCKKCGAKLADPTDLSSPEIELNPEESSSVEELPTETAQESQNQETAPKEPEQPPAPPQDAKMPEAQASAPPPPPRAMVPGRRPSLAPTSLSAPPPPAPVQPPPPVDQESAQKSGLPKPKESKQDLTPMSSDSKVVRMLDLALKEEDAGTDQKIDDDLLEEIDVDSGLTRNLFKEESLKSMRKQGMPPGMVKSLSSLKVIHAIAGGALLVALVVTIVIIAALPKDEVQIASQPPDNAVAEQQQAAAVPKPPEAPAPAPQPAAEPKPEAAGEPAEVAMPETEAPNVSLPAVPGGCKPFSMYANFLWKDQIDTLIRAAGKNGVCDLFGITSEAAASAYKGVARSEVSGYDLIKGGSVLEIFPGGKADRAEPTMELLFLGDKLFEIRLKYGQLSSSDMPDKSIEKILGKPFETGKDHLKRQFDRYVDGDLIVEYLEKKDRYRRVFHELVFASQVIRAAIISDENLRRQAEAAYEQGIDERNLRNFDKAIEKFNEARRLIPGMGMANIWEAWIQLHQENFAKVQELAEKTLKMSRDIRARAEAEGLLAVTSLFAGDAKGALKHYQDAAKIDPAKPVFKESITELESGNYRPTRVAMTAARIKCKDSVESWTTEGLLARGNFPSQQAYLKAVESVKSDPNYKKEFKIWEQWECR